MTRNERLSFFSNQRVLNIHRSDELWALLGCFYMAGDTWPNHASCGCGENNAGDSQGTVMVVLLLTIIIFYIAPQQQLYETLALYRSTNAIKHTLIMNMLLKLA